MYPENDNQTTTSLLLWPLTKNSRHYLCCNECHDHAANQRQGNLKLGIKSNHTIDSIFPLDSGWCCSLQRLDILLLVGLTAAQTLPRPLQLATRNVKLN